MAKQEKTVKKKSVSKKKTTILTQSITIEMLDARRNIKKYLDKNNLSEHYDVIDNILFNCEIRATVRATDVLIKPFKTN